MRPADCALIMALPLDFSAIKAAFEGGAYQDYVARSVMRGRAEDLWEKTFAAVAKSARKLIDNGRGHGVRVVENGTIRDVEAAFESRTTVTIIAHWRGTPVTIDDIRAPVEQIVDLIDRDVSAFGHRLRAGMPERWREPIANGVSERGRVSRLAEVLNARIGRRPELAPNSWAIEQYTDEPTLKYLNRQRLDSEWAGLIKPGNRLELADGLHSCDRLVAAVAPSWSGVADFSNCQSAQLIDQIKCGRSDRNVIGNINDTNPISRMLVIDGVYKLMARYELNYIDAREAIAQGLATFG